MNRRNALKVIAAAPFIGLAGNEVIAAQQNGIPLELVASLDAATDCQVIIKSIAIYFSRDDARQGMFELNGSGYTGNSTMRLKDRDCYVPFVDGRLIAPHDWTGDEQITGIEFEYQGIRVEWGFASNSTSEAIPDLPSSIVEDFGSTLDWSDSRYTQGKP